jgi:hypothetical protein
MDSRLILPEAKNTIKVDVLLCGNKNMEIDHYQSVAVEFKPEKLIVIIEAI